MSEQMNDNQIKHMVDRFLGWKLPGDFNPDGGISFKKSINENRPSWPQKNEPTGTNLFDADQAEEMIRYMVSESPSGPEAAPAPEAQAPAVTERTQEDACDPAIDNSRTGLLRENAALQAELAQLRARVAILDAQTAELPKLQLTEADKESVRKSSREYPDLPSVYFMALAQLMCRERQLLDSQRAVQAQRTIMCDLRNGLVAARDFIDSGDSGWFPQKWRDAIAAYDALAGKGE